MTLIYLHFPEMKDWNQLGNLPFPCGSLEVFQCVSSNRDSVLLNCQLGVEAASYPKG